MPLNLPNRNACLAASTLLLLGLGAPAAHAAHTFCCGDERGQQRCGDVLPEACRSRAYVEYNEAGIRVRSNARPLTAAEQAVRDAEDKKQRDIEEAAAQQQRSDQALLSTYADESDLNTARDRAVGELERSLKTAQEILVGLNNNKAKINADAEFYKGKPLPPDVKQKIARNQAAITEQQAAIDGKKQELEDTKAKFEGFRQRLLQLKAKDKTDTKG